MSPPSNSRARTLARAAAYLLAVAAGAFGGTLLATLATPRWMPPSWAWLIKATLVAAVVVVITRLFLRQAGRRWSDYGISPGRITTAMGRGILGGLVVSCAWVAAVRAIAPFDLSWNPEFIGAHLLAASLGTIAMAIAEEIGYRTYALAELRRGAGYVVAVVVTSTVFVAAHVAGGVPWPAGLLVVGSASVMFAVVMLESGSLPLVAAMHAATNLVQDNVLRPTPDASLLSMRLHAPPSAGGEFAIWLAIAGVNLVAVVAVLLVRRGAAADTE